MLMNVICNDTYYTQLYLQHNILLFIIIVNTNVSETDWMP